MKPQNQNYKFSARLTGALGAAVLLGATTFVAACSSFGKKFPEQKLVSHVDLPRFMGRWYVIASIPTMFEEGATNATETYTWNEAEQRIDIDFRYRDGSPSGKEKAIPQKGFVYDQNSNAEWRIQPFWPLKFAYLIIDLAEDYGDTTIGVPDRNHVWIMSRKPTISESRYQFLVEKIQGLGYKTEDLKKVPQVW